MYDRPRSGFRSTPVIGGIVLVLILASTVFIFVPVLNDAWEENHSLEDPAGPTIRDRMPTTTKASAEFRPVPETLLTDRGAGPESKLLVSVDEALSAISSLSSEYSGAELRQKQLSLVGRILEEGSLSNKELLELCRSLHLSVSDAILPACWSLILPRCFLSTEFDFSSLLADIPEGKLGNDFIGVAGSSMSMIGRQLTAADMQLLRDSASDQNFQVFVKEYFRSFAKNEPEKALAFLIDERDSLSDRNVAVMLHHFRTPDIFEELAETDLISSNAEPKNFDIIRSFASAWADVDPRSAAPWVSGINDPELRALASAAMMERWVVSDVHGAAAWLASTDLKGYDSSISVLASSLARYSPQQAKEWAAMIQNENLKASVISQISE